MRLLLLFILTVFASNGYSSSRHNPDILVYSKLDTKWNLFMLQELRTLMKNLSYNTDVLAYTYSDAPIIYDEASIRDFISNDAHLLVEKIEKISEIEILDVRPELSIHHIGYKIQKITPSASVVENSQGDVTFKVDVSIMGIEIFADQLALTFLLNSKDDTKRIPALNVMVNKPLLKVASDFPLNLQLDIKVKEDKDNLSFEFSNENFSQLLSAMKSAPDSFYIDYENISVPEVSLSIMGRDLAINSKRLKQAIENHRASLKTIMLKQLISLVEKGGIMKSLKMLSHKKISNELWFNTTNAEAIPSYLKIQDLSVVGDGVLAVKAKGDFCTFDNFSRNEKECSKHRATPVAKSTVSNSDYRYSQSFAENKMKKKSMSFIASLSEDYVNKLIATTIENGNWQNIEEAIGIKLGDRGAFVKFDQKGELASVYIDVVYDAGFFTGILLKERYVRFPVLLKVKSRIENLDAEIENSSTGEVLTGEFPHLIFNIYDVDLDENKMRYGIEEYNLISNIPEVTKIFQKTVIRKIKNALFDYDAPYDRLRYAKWKGNDLPALIFPELSNLQLDKITTESDRHGRLLLMLKAGDVEVFNTP